MHCVLPETPASVVARVMVESGTDAVPVVTAAGDLIGMVASTDLVVAVAAGLTTMFSLQALVNAGVVLGALPAKGLTLPFISYGGTSLIVSMFFAGVILNISRGDPPPPPPPEDPRPGSSNRRRKRRVKVMV